MVNYNTNKLIITGSQARYDGTISTIQIHALLLTDVTFYVSCIYFISATNKYLLGKIH